MPAATVLLAHASSSASAAGSICSLQGQVCFRANIHLCRQEFSKYTVSIMAVRRMRCGESFCRSVYDKIASHLAICCGNWTEEQLIVQCILPYGKMTTSRPPDKACSECFQRDMFPDCISSRRGAPALLDLICRGVPLLRHCCCICCYFACGCAGKRGGARFFKWAFCRCIACSTALPA